MKAALHAPITQPEMVEYGFGLKPGSEAFLSVTPEVMQANEDIVPISIEKRQCYLEWERPLEYYKFYSYLNCVMECASNHTFKVRNNLFNSIG